jgi:hypothetical protein
VRADQFSLDAFSVLSHRRSDGSMASFSAPPLSLPEFWGEVQPPASLKGLDIPPRRAVFIPGNRAEGRRSEWETRLFVEKPMLSTGLHFASESTPLLVRWPRVVSSAAMSRNDRRRPSRGSRGFQPLRRRKRKKSQEQTAPDPPSVEIATISSSSETTAVCQDWMVGQVDLRPLNNINRKSQGAGDSEALIGQRNL